MDYAAIALARLASQFQNSPKLKALLSAIVSPLNTLETDVGALKTARWIDLAEGAQLDGCGHIVGELRQGRTDTEYRKAIQFRIFVNISKGTPQDLTRGLRYLTEPTDAQYIESYPATSILFTNGFDIPSAIQSMMQELAPAAIATVPVIVSYGDTPFRFSREPAPSELFVNAGADYLTASGSDLQVSTEAAPVGLVGFGGAVPSELDVGIGYLDVGGPTLAVYNPNTLTLLGHANLPGVYQ